jgi:hypothetical protein
LDEIVILIKVVFYILFIADSTSLKEYRVHILKRD